MRRRTARLPTARLLTGAALAVTAAASFAVPALAATAVPAVPAVPAVAVPAHAGSAGTGTGTGTGTDAGRLEVYPATAVPGGQVSVNTADCGAGPAAGDAGAVGAGRFPLAPGAGEGEAAGRFGVPPSAQPGTYEIVAECAADGRRITGDLVVVLASDGQQTYPRGSVKTGVGGALGHDPVQTAAGVAALAVAAAGGTWLLHRRARGDGI
ncbi:hypothetical protein P1S61_19205 [Streptomyces sp. ME08-AFT2]|uniref:hypothetical protein n=1 Tax=Streptomyces sp. ME08-AFT2 TaxID=3028683 RepID=UPI0029BB5CD6|nr:hypothetical protein [Streptomyces sp. ME08-AFT2]MDX3311160.1 hypothetical protein [Streptomyces sp. ME08-AFT2]